VAGRAVGLAGSYAVSAAGELGAGLGDHDSATTAGDGWEGTADMEEQRMGEEQTVQAWAQR
jgi:hypothetical protein